MRIGIIAASNIRFSPYIYYYTHLLDMAGIDYELIYAKQELVEDDFAKPNHPIAWNNKNARCVEYWLYAKKVCKIIKKKEYDGLIVLTSIMATYMSVFLKKKYKEKYIVDIRDYTHENIYLYFLLEKIGISSSALSVISSPYFRKFLPDCDYKICHNINFQVDGKERGWRKPGSNRIIIGYIGAVIYKENLFSLINLVKKDLRFELHIHGFEPGKPDIDNFVSNLKCERIIFYDSYKPSEKKSLIESVDILFNTYGNGCLLLDTALSNKLYDAMYYKKLLLTSPSTAMEKMGGKIAFSIDYKSTDNLDELYNWVTHLNRDEVQEYQDEKFKEFLNENEITKNAIMSTINGWKNPKD